MTPKQLAARWLADVPRRDVYDVQETDNWGPQIWLHESDVLAAIASRLAPGDDLVERLQIPWPADDSAAEVTLPVWVIELCDEAAARIAALTATVAELTVERDENAQDAYTMGKWKRDKEAAEREAATLRDRLARIASAWPLVRDTDCSGGKLASAIDEIDAALTDGGSNG